MDYKLYQQGNKVYAEGLSDTTETVVIPSQKFPISGPLQAFHTDNTEECTDELLRSIYDSVAPQVGQCITNAETLKTAFLEAGIEKSRVQIHVGWLFVGKMAPFLHCYTVVDEKYVFDFISDWNSNTVDQFANCTGKESFAAIIRDRMKLSNLERFAPVGKVDPFYCYVGSIGKPSEARKLFAKLKRAYPNHPAFRSKIGELTETQKLIRTAT